MNKFVGILTSRKAWAAIISVAATFGVLEYSDAQQAELVEAIMVVVVAVGYMMSIAVEDGARHIADGQRLLRAHEALAVIDEDMDKEYEDEEEYVEPTRRRR